LIEIDIPGVGTSRFQHLVLDVNGTIAEDGVLLAGVADRLTILRDKVAIHLLTADTHGTGAVIEKALGLRVVSAPQTRQAEAKLEYIRVLNPETVVAVGNGANDTLMLEHAALGIFVIGPEAGAVPAMLGADVIAAGIREALDLLIRPLRLAATLRR